MTSLVVHHLMKWRCNRSVRCGLISSVTGCGAGVCGGLKDSMLKLRFYSRLSDQAKQIQNEIDISKQYEDIMNLRKRQLEVETILEQENTWDDTKVATKLSQELSTISAAIDYYNDIGDQVSNVIELAELATEENDQDMTDECSNILNDIHKGLMTRRLQGLMSSEQDQSGCYLEIVSGAGGADAFHWTKMLATMYTK
mmetsp:Transcript_22796/g.42565  ORF Transcript_22796/g.42565 Transcript_22796/m.42565 type:complete len:198 (-) Transcript_22796:5-598(-)